MHNHHSKTVMPSCALQRAMLAGSREQAALARFEEWANRNAWTRTTAQIKTRELVSGFGEVRALMSEQEALKFDFKVDQGVRS